MLLPDRRAVMIVCFLLTTAKEATSEDLNVLNCGTAACDNGWLGLVGI